MGALFRSEEMALCQLFLQPEAAYTSISSLGELGAVQFRDLNSEVNLHQRRFVQEVRRCDELERKLVYIEAELRKDEVTIPDLMAGAYPAAPNPREIINLEAHLEKTENEILELSQNSVNLRSNFVELTEFESVLTKSEHFFSDSSAQASSVLGGEEQQGQLGFIAGVISRHRIPAFERMLWRISRGNIFLRQADLDTTLEDPQTRSPMFKTVFLAFFQGEQLKMRLKKVCTGFHASMYPCPNDAAERADMIKSVRTRLEDLTMVLNQTSDHRQRVLANVAKELPNWSVMIKKMKAIYHTLNQFNMDVSRKCLIGECWVPVNDLPDVQRVLSEGSSAAGSTITSFLNVINTNEIPPTFNRTNRFTRGFQNLIDAYGIASYQEANPALYTIVTFPFLFGTMFGDMGHGLIMGLFALFMVLREKKMEAEKSSNEIRNIFFSGRYIILLMGIFSVYTGFIYNDVFSKSMNLFGSNWKIGYNESTAMEWEDNTLDPTFAHGDSIYPFGLDPVWQLASNKIIFLNSYKMKLSIIFGVTHMVFGVCVSLINHRHFKRMENVFLEFLPQIIFLLLLFAYMVFMMFFKWIVYDAHADTPLPNRPGCAPSVLILFINMLLFSHAVLLEGCEEYMFEGQEMIQTILVLVALICIPWLLLAKPIYVAIKRKMRRRPTGGQINQGLVEDESHEMKENEGSEPSPDQALYPNLDEIQKVQTTDLDVDSNVGDQTVGKNEGKQTIAEAQEVYDEHEEEPMSEVIIHQAIHTIEYILSTISHTASYLRLWALSLAHSQLSDVLWGRIFNIGLASEGYVMGTILIFITFAIWAFLSIAILVLMEGLSAFLHTLRLHWVEFMSKFYAGLGYGFRPFSFKIIIDGSEDEE